MERKLASIQRISEIRPIIGADNIEVANVLGWQAIVPKGKHKVDELVVWYEIDSFLPIKPEYEFLRKGCYKNTENLGEGFRIKTIKLKGQVSQGLALPWQEILSEKNLGYHVNFDDVFEGQDLTEFLGVKKYEAPIPAQLAGKVRGNFPGFIRKTDSERFQNLMKEIEKHLDEEFEVTTKLDGSSMTVYSRWNEGLSEPEIGVCSRNMNLIEDNTNSFWNVANRLGIPQILRDMKDWSIAIQGELMGPGVQKNKEKLPELDFYVFNIYLINEQQYLPSFRRAKLFESLGKQLKHVPILHKSITLNELLGDPIDRDELREALIDLSKGPMMNGQGHREGIVFKHLHSDFNFKVINPDFLLKYDE